jgi:diguanylate cyclase (GGDEF)-like protein/PAS domain S-box-containing protein
MESNCRMQKRTSFPAIVMDEEGRHRHAAILKITTYILLIYSVVASQGGLLGGRSPLVVIYLALLNGGAMLLALGLQWLGHPRTAGIVVVFSGLAAVTAITYHMGTIHVPAPAGFVLLVIVAGLLFDGAGIAAAAVYSSLAVLGLFLAEKAGLLPTPDPTTTITQWVTLTLLFGLTAALSYYSHHLMNQALQNYKLEILVRQNADDELRRTHDELAQSEERFDALFHQAHDAVVLIGMDGRPSAANRRAEELLGYSVAEMGKDSLLGLAKKIAAPADFLALNRVTGGENVPMYETSFTNRQGRRVWVEVNAELVRDRKGTPLHVQSVLRDITARKQAEAALLESERRYRLISENTVDVIWVLDLHTQKYTFMSPSVEKLRGCTVEEVLAQTMEESVTPESYRHIIEVTPRRVTGFLRGDLSCQMNVDEIDQLHKDGRLIHTEATTTILVNGAGGVEVLGVTRDITARKQAEEALRSANLQLNQRVAEVEYLQEELREQALRDPLTGLHNRRYLSETLPRLLLQAAREQKPVSILNADIDHFKVINDTYGHQVGDRFLREVARVIKSCTRGMDVVCRYGGEEFLVILFGAGRTAGENRAEDIRVKCAEIAISVAEQQDAQVTISVGAAVYPEHGEDAEKLIIHSDLALYASKNTGRNRVTVWSEELRPPGKAG